MAASAEFILFLDMQYFESNKARNSTDLFPHISKVSWINSPRIEKVTSLYLSSPCLHGMQFQRQQDAYESVLIWRSLNPIDPLLMKLNNNSLGSCWWFSKTQKMINDDMITSELNNYWRLSWRLQFNSMNSEYQMSFIWPYYSHTLLINLVKFIDSLTFSLISLKKLF